MNTLYFGDNLEILRDKIEDACVDLIYLDPPFQSGKNYNIIFQPEAGKIKGATAQIKTFEDTWHWGEEAEKEYRGLIEGNITIEKPPQKLIDLMKAMRGYLGECPMMAYLCMMSPRLLEMRRVLKPTGSIYLHCDPTASHYLKILMDSIFGIKNFRNEIVWCYRGAGYPKRDFGRRHDTILRYSKSDSWVFNLDDVREEYAETTKERFKHYIGNIRDGKDFGKQTLHPLGKQPDDWWQIQPIAPSSKERIGYPTQKPEKLLERIIKASSNEGDLVLDPFCGCGTAIAVAEATKRRWIGIDITYLAIDIIKKRLEKNKIQEGKDFKVDGGPFDVNSAQELAKRYPFQFQIWCVSKLNATPSPTKTADKGVDGFINFLDKTRKEKFGKGIIQVKGTKQVSPSMVRDLKGTMQSQNADFGILITLQSPTRDMKTEAIIEGEINILGKKLPKIQLLTVEDLFKNPIPVKLPPLILPPFRKPEIKGTEEDPPSLL